jgi:aerobic-type carbon monoxide dehydrogenase small subunit (CoxS/CutS family)
MPAFQITVNGRRRSVDVDADTPLLWVLRDTLGLTGTKFGCGRGICGSCTVHLDGKAVRSCQVSAREAMGSAIVTIEGLSKEGSHPVQRAWLEEDVAQCGYCQPGMIMTASALLAAHPRPTDGQIDEAIGDHICRCGSYPRIRKAIHRAAKGGAK